MNNYNIVRKTTDVFDIGCFFNHLTLILTTFVTVLAL